MSIIEQIKAEIDKLYGEYKYKFHQCGDQYHLGLIDGLDMAERVLDSLESGKPVPNDLEEAAKKCVTSIICEHGLYDGDFLIPVCEDFFKAGAEWHKEQMIKKHIPKEHSELTELEYAFYDLLASNNITNHSDEEVVKTAKVTATDLMDIAKAEMMKEAVECELVCIKDHLAAILPMKEFQWTVGDKVRIIIVKED